VPPDGHTHSMRTAFGQQEAAREKVSPLPKTITAS
jgi:hypothetical protein